MENPDDIVGHKTIATGELDPVTGLPAMRHVPMTRSEANALWESIEQAKRARAERMPDESTAIHSMCDAWYRLKELGWCEAIYCPKDGTHFQAIEAGSTGIHDCSYVGEWAEGSWWIHEHGDMSPSHPALFKLYPEDQAKHNARMAAARERFQKEMANGGQSASED